MIEENQQEMIIFEKIKETQEYLEKIKKKGLSIGFVPTMGSLHEGHLSLIREAKRENNFVVCSIFVNPIQFNNKNDLQNYPRDLESDIELLKNENCDLLFSPSVEEMYPEPSEEIFDFGGLDQMMEGLYRKDHFKGVATVVKKLFEIITPVRAYFGLNDYKQLIIIHKITRDNNIPVEVVPCATIREENGLAMSSRNRLLSKSERKQASLIYETLKMVKIQSGYLSISEIKEMVERQLRRYRSIKIEYFEIVDMYTLKSLKTWAESNHVIACIAVYVGKVRLIDNVILFS